MKKLFVLCLSILLITSTLSGCGDKIVRPTELPAASIEPAQSPTAGADNYPVELSQTEVADFQSAFSAPDNYGFLLSNYDNVVSVDLLQVLYTGAGMNNPENSSEIVAAYLAASNEDTPDCDSTILTTQQINNFLLLKTGHPLSDMKNPLEWAYIAQFDAYIHFHGDTNYVTATCTGGRSISENLYEIEYTFDGGWYDSNGNAVTGGTVTVKSKGNEMQFVSNSMH